MNIEVSVVYGGGGGLNYRGVKLGELIWDIKESLGEKT